MGNINYNFISESLFAHEESINNQFYNETDERLEKELQNYRKFCVENYEELVEEITTNKSFLKVFTSADHVPLSLLKQTALYLDQYIIPDPLFKKTERKSEISRTTSKHLGYQTDQIDRQDLSKACKYLKTITPMIAGNYIKLFPLSYFFERPTIPYYYTDNQFSDVLPSEILSFFQENAKVSSLEKMSSGGWQIMDGNLYPCRGIAIEFAKANPSSGMIFHLIASEVVKTDDETREVVFRNWLPDTPPETEEFEAWVTQSINSTARKYFNEVFTENLISANLNATYLCDNLFTNDLISKHFQVHDSVQSFTTNQIINLEIPFLDKIDVDKLMSIRELDADTFTNFRLELEKQFRELRSITDEKTLKQKAQNILHELNNVQGEKIRRKIKHINKQVAINTILGAGGLLASFQTGGLSLIATALALGKGYRDITEYREKVRENPAFLLWKIQH